MRKEHSRRWAARLVCAGLAAILAIGALQILTAGASPGRDVAASKPSPFDWGGTQSQPVAPQSAGHAAFAALKVRIAAHPWPALASPLAHIAAGAGTIVQSGLAPFPGFVFRGQNRWYEVKNGATIIVYAGAMGQDATQGEVIVEQASAGYHTIAGPFVYRTPVKTGAVHVTGASGERLTLQAANGASIVFDMASRGFAAS